MAEPKPIRKQRSGTASKITGTVFLTVGTFCFIWALASTRDEFLSPLDPLVGWLVLLSGLFLAPIGAFLNWRGRQRAARASAQDIITCSTAHVLYLRAFRTDRSIWGAVLHACWPASLRAFIKTEEEQLADVLRPFGDLIAVGRPGESLPTPGAARIYTADDEWQDVVKRRIKEAQLVVIKAAAGENVLWELTQAIEILNPQKLLIFFENMGLKEYGSFRTRANSVLAVPLPEAKQVRRWYGRVQGFISFDADWKPSFFTLTGPYFRSNSFKSRCKFALKPIFESRGLEWRRPRVSGTRVFGLLFVGIFLPMAALGWGLWFWEDPPFPSQQHKDAFVRQASAECKSESAGIADVRIRKILITEVCDCGARELADAINAREVKALESGQILPSQNEKAKKAARRCARLARRSNRTAP